MNHPKNFLAVSSPTPSAETINMIGITLVTKAVIHKLRFVGSWIVIPEPMALNIKIMNGMIPKRATNFPRSCDIALAIKAIVPATPRSTRMMLGSSIKQQND